MIQGTDAGALSIDQMSQIQEEMKQALAEQNKKIIMEKTEKAFKLRESAANRGMLSLDELDEAKSKLLEMQQIEAKNALRKQLMAQEANIANVVVSMYLFYFFYIFFCILSV